MTVENNQTNRDEVVDVWEMDELMAYAKQQFRGGQSEGSHIVVERFAIECKHYKKLGGLINRAYEQAKRDAKEGYIPICICKGDGQEPLVTMGYDDFWQLIKEWRRGFETAVMAAKKGVDDG